MNVQIRSKDINLSDHTKEHLNAALESFTKYNLEITTANVMIKKDKNGVNVEFDLHIAHHQPVVISQSDAVLDAAIDLAIDRASKALRRMHDKEVSHRGGSIKDVEVLEEV